MRDLTPDSSTNGSHPFDVLLAKLIANGARPTRRTPETARLLCPVHHDSRPSLVLTRRPDRVLLKCFAGCRTADIVGAAGLRMSDLFTQGQLPRQPRRTVATYDYLDTTGKLMAQKVRLEPKEFRWRTPDPRNPGRWRPTLDGVAPGLYRLAELTGRKRVFLLEGEKAVDFFWNTSLPACCPPSGASRWTPEWSADLHKAGCEELVILADADRVGDQHAEHVAATCFQYGLAQDEPMAVKVIRLPGLMPGADAYDWLSAGRSVADLNMAIAAVPAWRPGALQRERLDRKRAQTRERVRKFRQREKNRTGLTEAVVCNAANDQKLV